METVSPALQPFPTASPAATPQPAHNAQQTSTRQARLVQRAQTNQTVQPATQPLEPALHAHQVTI